MIYQLLAFIVWNDHVLPHVYFLFPCILLSDERLSFRCSLGDVTNNDDHYKKALEVSNSKSARAMVKLMLILFSFLDHLVCGGSLYIGIGLGNGINDNRIAHSPSTKVFRPRLREFQTCSDLSMFPHVLMKL